MTKIKELIEAVQMAYQTSNCPQMDNSHVIKADEYLYTAYRLCTAAHNELMQLLKAAEPPHQWSLENERRTKYLPAETN